MMTAKLLAMVVACLVLCTCTSKNSNSDSADTNTANRIELETQNGQLNENNVQRNIDVQPIQKSNVYKFKTTEYRKHIPMKIPSDVYQITYHTIDFDKKIIIIKSNNKTRKFIINRIELLDNTAIEGEYNLYCNNNGLKRVGFNPFTINDDSFLIDYEFDDCVIQYANNVFTYDENGRLI